MEALITWLKFMLTLKPTVIAVLVTFLPLSSAVARVQHFYHSPASSISHLYQVNKQNNITTLFADANRKKSNLLPLSQTTDKANNRHTRYRQYLNGVPIWNYQLIMHRHANSHQEETLSGQLHEIDPTNIPSPQPSYNQKTAIELAKKIIKDQTSTIWRFKRKNATLYYYLPSPTQIRLAYVVEFFITRANSVARPFIVIDAHNKQILDFFDKLATKKIGTGPGGNQKPVHLGGLGLYEYGDAFNHDFLDIKKTHNNCLLENDKVLTLDMHHQTEQADPIYFPCTRHAGDAINGAASPTNDAHYFATVVANMFVDWFGITPLKGKIKLRVHYDNNYDNAFWDGQTISFGDGSEIYYPLTSLDVVAHEIAHGFTEEHANLVYVSQSGGIDEAFSDMASVAANYYLYHKVHWQLGRDILKVPQAVSRSMSKPAADGHSFEQAKEVVDLENKTPPPTDLDELLDPHFTSGVFNKAFYELATMPGWDPKKAFEVMLSANRDYWTPYSTFTDAAWGVMQSAYHLHYNTDEVAAAFKRVGILCSMQQCYLYS